MQRVQSPSRNVNLPHGTEELWIHFRGKCCAYGFLLWWNTVWALHDEVSGSVVVHPCQWKLCLRARPNVHYSSAPLITNRFEWPTQHGSGEHYRRKVNANFVRFCRWSPPLYARYWQRSTRMDCFLSTRTDQIRHLCNLYLAEDSFQIFHGSSINVPGDIAVLLLPLHLSKKKIVFHL